MSTPTAPSATSPLHAVVDQRFTVHDFTLESGVVLPEMTLAYETYGRLAPDGRNAILATHGYTSSAHAAGPPTPTDPLGGWWDGLIGPGKTIDSDRWFVVASNTRRTPVSWRRRTSGVVRWPSLLRFALQPCGQT